jgi:membrane protease YdiL (CAAX protease family)
MFKRFLFFFTLAILNGFFLNYINNNFFNYKNDTENSLIEFSKIYQIIIIILISPVIETYIFQHLPSTIFYKLKVRNPYLLIILPSIFFSLMHFYNPVYLLMAFFGGIILNTYYYGEKKLNKNYFILTVLLHSFYNLYGFLFVV